MSEDIEAKKMMLQGEIKRVCVKIDRLAEDFNNVEVSSSMDFKEWKATRTTRNKFLETASELYAVKEYLEEELAQLEQSNLDDFEEEEGEEEED